MKTILLVFGTRPEAVKMCPLAAELRKYPDLRTVVCVTGQHRQMLDSVMRIFDIEPDYDLNIMRPSQTLFDITEAVLSGLRPILENEAPDIVLVQGDTTTAFAAALAAFYLHIPVGHIEAGLRTYDINAPYPEEFNRQAIGSLASLHFAPTQWAKDNLVREGKPEDCVYITGNTVVDAMRRTVTADYADPVLAWAGDCRLVFLTAHRRENLGEPLRGMLRAVRRVLDEHPDVKLVFPMHPNPSVRGCVRDILGDCPQAMLTEPVSVVECHNLESHCYLCLTDSGGIQEECTALGKPVLVLRDVTERPEGVEAGVLCLAGTEETSVYRYFTRLLDDAEDYSAMAHAANVYGDGHACEIIAGILRKTL